MPSGGIFVRSHENHRFVRVNARFLLLFLGLCIGTKCLLDNQRFNTDQHACLHTWVVYAREEGATLNDSP